MVVKGYRMWLVGVARRGQSRDGVRAMHLLGTCGLSVDLFFIFFIHGEKFLRLVILKVSGMVFLELSGIVFLEFAGIFFKMF